jgi:hypothetical protein
MDTHYAVYDAFSCLKNEHIHYKGRVNLNKLLLSVKQEGYFLGKNLFVLPGKLVFCLDDGNIATLYLHTIH